MKVIFLDIDGVLNYRHMRDICPKAVALLNSLVEKTGANIVISSSWRISVSMIRICEELVSCGFKFPERIIGCTPSVPERERGHEIKLWLKQVPVDKFVIIDDLDDVGNLFPFLVKTDTFIGLQQVHVDKALGILS